MRISLKKMGDTLDRACKPAGQCNCCPITLSLGDWFYDPSMPNVICHQPQSGSQIIETTPCNETDEYLNEASGVVYKYSAQTGMYAVSFAAADSTYVIYGEISGAVVMPDNCTLIFQGGKFTGSLTGSNTAIEAGPVQIFDVGIQLYGSFVNECAYPEWWGAVASLRTATETNNCRASIQAAFDSIFGEIRFCPGFYYVANAVQKERQELALLYLNNAKVIRMSGNSHMYKGLPDDGATSVIWTKDDVNILLINVLKDNEDENVRGNNGGNNDDEEDQSSICRTMIVGGEINATKCIGFSHSAILVYPKSLRGLKIETSLIGPIPAIYRDDQSGTINWPNGERGTQEVHCPTLAEINAGYLGYGIRFRHNPTSINNQGAYTGDHKGVCYLTDVECKIYGFGHGFCVDHSSNAATITSMELRGYIDNCLRYVYAPSPAFGGGVVECVIQTRAQNAIDGFAEPIIQGSFAVTYLNPMIWDLGTGIDALRMSSGSKNVRLGQRLVGVMRTRFHSYGFGEDSSSASKEAAIRSLATMTSADCSTSLGAFGNFDLLDLSAVNALVQSANYVHLIDNDLLSIDKMVSDFGIAVQQEGFTPKYPAYGGIHKPGSSPFDRGGMVFAFVNKTSNPDAYIRVTASFPADCQYPLQFLAFHLKGSIYSHFTNLRVEMTRSDNTVGTLYDGSYTGIQRDDGRSDIILPIIFKEGQKRTPKSLVFTFTGFVYEVGIWGSSEANEDFKFSVEGRFNRHLRQNIFTSSGGAMGKPLTKLGKLFISGTETYSTLSKLPNDAANGALATVGSSSVLANYPVVKTQQGWFIQNLVGSTSTLNDLPSSVGSLTAGQQAFNTTVGKPVWWNGSHWIDATGATVS